MLQILHFIIHGGKIGYVFVVGNKFFTLRTTPGNSDLLDKEVNSQAKTFDESAVIYIDAFFLNHEEQKIFRKSHLILSKSVAKIYIGVFGFKGISAGIAETLEIQAKNGDIADTINLIGAHESISSFSNNEMGLSIDNLKDVGRVTVIINIYFLQKSLLPRVQLVSFLFILIDIRKFLRQARRRDGNRYRSRSRRRRLILRNPNHGLYHDTD